MRWKCALRPCDYWRNTSMNDMEVMISGDVVKVSREGPRAHRHLILDSDLCVNRNNGSLSAFIVCDNVWMISSTDRKSSCLFPASDFPVNLRLVVHDISSFLPFSFFRGSKKSPFETRDRRGCTFDGMGERTWDISIVREDDRSMIFGLWSVLRWRQARCDEVIKARKVYSFLDYFETSDVMARMIVASIEPSTPLREDDL